MTCKCDDCSGTDNACQMDCERDSMCQGCQDNRDEALDREHDEMCALGYK